MSKPLDSEYRRRWEEYHLGDGTVLDSRRVNWRDVAWGEVVRIVARVEGHVHAFDFLAEPGFQGYLRFRWYGQEAQFSDQGEYTGHQEINEWCYGWTDGRTAHLTDINFYDGAVVRTYSLPLSEVRGHVHPDIAARMEA